MTFNMALSRLSCVAACACAVVSAQAGIAVYDSQADFLQAASNTAIDDFDTLPAGFIDGPLDRSAGSWSYQAAVDGGFFIVGTPTDNWLSTNVAVPITFSAFGAEVGAVGGYFFATGLDGTPLDSESISVTATDAAGSVTRTVVGASPTSFLGFMSTTGAIVELRVAVTDTGFNNAWATVNDLTLGRSITAVPEPAAPALLLVGLAAVAATTARRRRGA